MIRVGLLLLGALTAVIFATFILVIIPRFGLPVAPSFVPLKPYISSESPLKPYSAIEERGRGVYIANGCVYCHSQQIRDPIFSNDVNRGWGRPSYPSDYLYDSPALLGTMRTGPDLANVGVRLPDPSWHLVHLYQPRALISWSIMPAFPFLFEVKDVANPGDEVVKVPDGFAPTGKVVVATEDAKALVAYLLSLKRDFPPPELKMETERLKQRGEAE